MNQNDLYLAHHGRLGQRWGKKMGPPYPLDYDKLSAEEREEAKKNAIERGDVKEANKNVKYFNNQEIKAVMDRLDTMQRLSKVSEVHVKTGYEKVNDLLDKAGNLNNKLNNAIGTYNSIAKISNTFLGSKLPQIKDGGNNEKKKDNNNNGNSKKDKKDKKKKVVKVNGEVVSKEKKYTDLLGREVTSKYDAKSEKKAKEEKAEAKSAAKEAKAAAKEAKTKAKNADYEYRLQLGTRVVDGYVKNSGMTISDAAELVSKRPEIKIDAQTLSDQIDYIPIRMNGKVYYEKDTINRR